MIKKIPARWNIPDIGAAAILWLICCLVFLHTLFFLKAFSSFWKSY